MKILLAMQVSWTRIKGKFTQDLVNNTHAMVTCTQKIDNGTQNNFLKFLFISGIIHTRKSNIHTRKCELHTRNKKLNIYYTCLI